MRLEELNALPEERARGEFTRCCGSRAWVEGMLLERPFPDPNALFRAASEKWLGLGEKDWLEAFSHHPKIGAPIGTQNPGTANWESQEQRGVQGAAGESLRALAVGNEEYQRKFGFIFLVCATGKTAEEMLGLLRHRMHNEPRTEIRVAAQEQGKITRIRLEKLLNS